MRIVGVRKHPRWGSGISRKARRLAGPVTVRKGTGHEDRPLHIPQGTRQNPQDDVACPSTKGDGLILPGPSDKVQATADRLNDRERSPAPTDTVRPGEYDAVLHAESAVGERRKPAVKDLKNWRRSAPRQEERA